MWDAPPSVLELPHGEVHLWRAQLQACDADFARLGRLLAGDERERAARFHLDLHRRTYTLSRGILRVILAGYLHEDPARLVLATGDYGKPFLATHNLRFNLSHSSGLALYAFATGADVGIDLERITSDLDYTALAERFFSPAEREELLSLPVQCRREAFFTCWSRKEAFVKALGEGLSMGLADFDVTMSPLEMARVIEVRGRPEEARRWSLRALDLGRAYAAAVAVEGNIVGVRCWDWTGR